MDRALDMDDGAHVRLPVCVLDGVRRVEHGNRACFVAVASFRPRSERSTEAWRPRAGPRLSGTSWADFP